MILFLNRYILGEVMDCLDVVNVLYLRAEHKNINIPVHRRFELGQYRECYGDLVKDIFLNDVEFLEKNVVRTKKTTTMIFDLEMISWWKINTILGFKITEFCMLLEVEYVRQIMMNIPKYRSKIYTTFERDKLERIEGLIDLVESFELNIFNINMIDADSSKIIKLYIERGASLSGFDENGNTILHKMIRHNKTENIHQLIAAGYFLDEVDKFGHTPIMMLCWSNIFDNKYKHDMIKYLCEKKANLEIMYSDNGRTALGYAIECGNANIVELLIQEKANINTMCSKINTPLLLAICCNNVKIVSILLEKKADPNYRGLEENDHPLIQSIYRGSIITKMLIDAKACLESLDNNGYNALDLAIKRGKHTHVSLLVEAGAVPNKMTPAEEKKRKLDAIKSGIAKGNKTNSELKKYIDNLLKMLECDNNDQQRFIL